MKLLSYDEQAPSELLSVRSIITNEKSLFTLSDNELGDIHCEVLQDKYVVLTVFHIWRFRGLNSESIPRSWRCILMMYFQVTDIAYLLIIAFSSSLSYSFLT